MALFLKQDFGPPFLSIKWISMKFRPNMLLHSRDHVITILETGLLFREDSFEVEQECPSPEDVWRLSGGCHDGWFTKGERVTAAATLATLVAVLPPRNISKWTAIRAMAWLAGPMLVRWHLRRLGRATSLARLVSVMRSYLTLARRVAACVKEYAAVHNRIGSVTSAVESTRELLCHQQSSLAVTLSRASSALLGNVPWLRGDLAWDAVKEGSLGHQSLTKIHHAFLVVQSTFLKHVAMAHFTLTPQQQKMYKNHNERLYWIHTVLIEHLYKEFKESHEVLERMYRLLKNYGSNDERTLKKLGHAVNNSWLYSEVHGGIARASLEMKLCLEKCTDLDIFLDSCATDNQDISFEILSKDIDNIVEAVTKCLATLQASQIRLNKMHNRVVQRDEQEMVYNDAKEEDNVIIIDDKEPEIRDEVFYFIKTEDEGATQAVGDAAGPGKRERELTKVVLNELKRKLVKREDAMRERERQALKNTMPDVGNVEFPRQISIAEYATQTGYLNKIIRRKEKPLFRNAHTKTLKIHKTRKTKHWKKCTLNMRKYVDKNEIEAITCDALKFGRNPAKLFSYSFDKRKSIITVWHKCYVDKNDSSSAFEDFNNDYISDHNSNKSVDASKEYKVSKLDLELSSSDSDFDEFSEKNKVSILKDIRKYRVGSKKNYPVKKYSKTVNGSIADEQLRPVEYRFGTGMTMASVLQVNSLNNGPRMAEEFYVGDGEVSDDSGNDENV